MEYEGLHLIYKKCGLYWHMASTCPIRKVTKMLIAGQSTRTNGGERTNGDASSKDGAKTQNPNSNERDINQQRIKEGKIFTGIGLMYQGFENQIKQKS